MAYPMRRTTAVFRLSCSVMRPRLPQTPPSSSSQRRFAMTGSSVNEMIKNMPKQESMASRMKRMSRSDMPDDVGLLPNTYIRPCGNMPSWFSHPRLRWQLEILYLKQSLTDFAISVYRNRWAVSRHPITGKSKKNALGLRDRYEIAQRLHTELYESLATRDKTRISKVACRGLTNQQLARLDRVRMSGEPPETWTVKYRGWTLPSKLYFTIQSLIPSYFKAFHVVADRQGQLPVGPGVTFRQVIVRVDSLQSLQRENESTSVTKDMREYIVLQRITAQEKDEEWKIWGTIKPTETKEALEIIDQSRSQEGSLTDRVRSAFSGIMG